MSRSPVSNYIAFCWKLASILEFYFHFQVPHFERKMNNQFSFEKCMKFAMRVVYDNINNKIK